MLLRACAAAWRSLLWALAALHTLRGSSAQQRSSTTRQGSGSCRSDTSDWFVMILVGIIK